MVYLRPRFFSESSPVFAALGAAVSSPLPWYVAASVLAASGALIGAVWCWRGR